MGENFWHREQRVIWQGGRKFSPCDLFFNLFFPSWTYRFISIIMEYGAELRETPMLVMDSENLRRIGLVKVCTDFNHGLSCSGGLPDIWTGATGDIFSPINYPERVGKNQKNKDVECVSTHWFPRPHGLPLRHRFLLDIPCSWWMFDRFQEVAQSFEIAGYQLESKQIKKTHVAKSMSARNASDFMKGHRSIRI